MSAELNRGRTLLLGSLTLLFTLLCLELLLQGFYYFTAGAFLFRRTAPPLFEADATRCYRVLANLDYTHRTNEFSSTIYTNALGLRTDERRAVPETPKPPDLYRILLLGPSFAFGWGSDYEDSFGALIAEQLSVPGKRVELMNLGTPAQSPGPQLCWLEREGERYDPDLVIQVSYGSRTTRLPDECPETLSCPVVEGGRLYSQTPTLRRRMISLVKNLATVFYGYYVYQTLAPWTLDGDAAEAGKELYAESEASELSPEAAADRYARFVAFAQRVTGKDTAVAFVHIPLSFMVHPKDESRWRHIVRLDPAAARARTRVEVEAMRARGLTMIETTDALMEQADAERLYYWLDIHLTPAGNRVVAEQALPILRELVARD